MTKEDVHFYENENTASYGQTDVAFVKEKMLNAWGGNCKFIFSYMNHCR